MILPVALLAALAVLNPSLTYATPVCYRLATGATNNSGTTYSTAVTLNANKLVLAKVAVGIGAGTSVRPNITMSGTSWVNVAHQATGTKMNSVSRTMTTEDKSGTLTIDLMGVSHTAGAWSIEQCEGVPTTGTAGRDAIETSNTETGTGNGAEEHSCTAMAHINNRPTVSMQTNNNPPISGTVEAGWNTMMDAAVVADAVHLISVWRPDSNDATFTYTRTGAWASTFVCVQLRGNNPARIVNPARIKGLIGGSLAP